MRTSRRTLLSELGAVAMADWLLGCEQARDSSPSPIPDVFRHGVASGDPTADGVVIWTRLSGTETDPVEVSWEMSTTAEFEEVAAEGTLDATEQRDFCVKVDVTGLDAATTYFYRFRALGAESPVGRTRTAPRGDARSLRFGLVSCSNYGAGYFLAYRELAGEELDLVVHLGDYIYEYASGESGDVRELEPEHELVTLADYRRRFAHYRRDTDLQALHAAHPMAAIWDDHELANDAWRDGAQNHDADEGSFGERKQAAHRAYFEWMPIREPEGELKVQRVLSYGELADLILVDARGWGRDAPVSNPGDPEITDPERSILGADQEAWLADALTSSTARWRLIGNQVMMSPLPDLFNGDSWDGYPESRRRLLSTLAENEVENVLVLTGDIHMSWACDLSLDPNDSAVYDPMTGEGALGVEVTVPGVTSAGLSKSGAALAEASVADDEYVKYAELKSRGYVLLSLSEGRAQADYHHFSRVDRESEVSQFSAGIRVDAGVPGARVVREPSGD
jgi:alkaline phosphatase D